MRCSIYCADPILPFPLGLCWMKHGEESHLVLVVLTTVFEVKNVT